MKRSEAKMERWAKKQASHEQMIVEMEASSDPYHRACAAIERRNLPACEKFVEQLKAAVRIYEERPK